MKRQFLWHQLSAKHRGTFLLAQATRRHWLNVALRAALHALALTYMLALSLVFGRLAAQHVMPLRLPALLADGVVTPQMLGQQCPAEAGPGACEL